MNYLLSGFSGRFGNRILQHLDAYSYAESCGINVFSADGSTKMFLKKNQHRAFIPIKRKWKISESLFNDKKINVGEYFLNIDDFRLVADDSVAIHFRGTDFAGWKSHSIIDPGFFIESALRISGEERKFFIVTDDPLHKNVLKIEAAIRKERANVYVVSGSEYADFFRLMNASIVIASPSTFSLAAVLLGRKKIIFPKEYAMLEAQSGASFWNDCINEVDSKYIEINLK